MKKALLFIGIPLLVLSGIASGLVVDLYRYADTPASASDSDTVVVDVRPGQTMRATADSLHRNHLIKSPFKFILIARISGFDKHLKAGEYLFSAAMSPRKILETMVAGAVVLHKLTVPEGLNIYQVAELLERAGFGTQSAFIQTAGNADRARAKGLEADSFEGYLFPDTYFFPKDAGVEQIISAMVSRFWSVFTAQWQLRAKELGFSVHEIVTLASIIEKETGDPAERPVISSVFHNRLKKKMRLESDPTVIYGINDFDGNLTRKHLVTTTPYNTYKIIGLPSGPIANPGRASLEAALYPDETAFIYFVSKKDSTHHFSTNLRDHNEAVRKYQLRRKQ